MRAALLALAVSSSVVGFFVACSDDTPAGPGSSSGTDGGRTDESPDDDPEGATDAGFDGPVNKNGCRLKTTDYRVGEIAENVARTDSPGAVAWTDVENALSDDGKHASVTLNDGQESQELRISKFGIKLPEAVETWGIEVELRRQAPEGGVEDAKITLVIDGWTDEQIDWKYVKGSWPISRIGTHHYGQAEDTWKVNLFPADVNKDTFAARLWVRKMGDAGPGAVTAIVEAMKVAVWYCDDPSKYEKPR